MNVSIIPTALTEQKIRKVKWSVWAEIDGVLTEITDDVISIDYIEIDLEKKQDNRSTLGKPSASVASITINNSDGKYSPSKQSSPYYGKFKRNTRIIIKGGFIDPSDGISKTMELFHGVCTNFKSSITPKEKKITVTLKDFAKFGQRKKNPNHNYGWDHYNSGPYPDKIFEAVLFDKTISEAIEYLVEYTWGSVILSNAEIQTMNVKYPVIEFDLNSGVWSTIQKLCEATDGRVYWKGNIFNFLSPLSPDWTYLSVSVYEFNSTNIYDIMEQIDEESIINKVKITSNGKTLQPRQIVCGTPNTNVQTSVESYKFNDTKLALSPDNKTITLKSQDGVLWINTINIPLVDTLTYSDLSGSPLEDSSEVLAMLSTSLVKVWDKLTNTQLIVQDLVVGNSTTSAKVILKNAVNPATYDLQITYQYYTNQMLYGKERWFQFELDKICQNIEYPIISVSNGYNPKVFSTTVSGGNLYLSDWEIFDGNTKIKYKLTNNVLPELIGGQTVDKIYITKHEIYANPLECTNKLVATAIDDATMDEFENSLVIENDYIVDEDFMNNIASLYRHKYKQERSFLTVPTKGIPQIELLDLVNIIEPNVAGFDDTYKFSVVGYRHVPGKSTDNWKTHLKLESLVPAWVYDGSGITITNPYAQTGNQVLEIVNITGNTSLTAVYDGVTVKYSTTLSFNAPSTFNISNFFEGRVLRQESLDGISWGNVITVDSFTDPYTNSYTVNNLMSNTYYKFYIQVSDRNNSKSELGSGYQIAANAPPVIGGVQNLIDFWENSLKIIGWDLIAGIPNLQYEIRLGSTWANSQFMGKVLTNRFVCLSPGTYWIAAWYGGESVATSTPASITISESINVRNLIATYDEAATGWSGTCGTGVVVVGSDLILGGTSLFDDIADVDAVVSLDAYGGVLPNGTYTIPVGHIIDIGTAQACNIGTSITVTSDSNYTSAKSQINIQQNDLSWSGWQDIITGQYVGKAFNFRAILYSTNTEVTCVVSAFTFFVDVPDLFSSGKDLVVPNTGSTITFSRVFHVVSAVLPVISTDMQTGDYWVVSNVTLTTFDIDVYDATDTAVQRHVSYIAQGY